MFVHTNAWRSSEPIPIFVGIYSGVWDFRHRYEDKRTMTEKYEYVYAGAIVHTVTNALPASPPPTSRDKDMPFFIHLRDNFHQFSLFNAPYVTESSALTSLIYVHKAPVRDIEDIKSINKAL